MNLLEKYRAGDCEQVWRQIVDEQVPATNEDAMAVAQETVIRARDNFAAIHQRLVELGYEFAEPEDAFVATCPEDAAPDIAAVEEQFGALPGLARIWYSHIHSVNFSQSRTQCSFESDHILRNLGWYPKAVYLPLKKCREMAAENLAEYRNWYESMQSRDLAELGLKDYLSGCKTPSEMAQFLPLGGHASNCDAKGFMLPSELADAVFYNDGEATYFNEDLRYAMKLGGFPNLSSEFRKQCPQIMQLGHPDPDALAAHLTRDLRPI